MFSKILILSLFFACNIKKEKTLKVEKTSGAQIYSDRCLVCHGADGKLGLNGAKNLSLSLITVDEIKMQVTNGKGAMTPFKNILTPEEIEAVAVYSLSLRSK